ncbi:MAG: hypothetical protein ACXWGX_06870 [Usitatibacter sp.]
MAAADGRLYLASHGKIHVFGADGARQRAIDLEALGVSPRPSDFDVHDDGRLLIADPNESTLLRCAPAGPCERIDPGLKRMPGQTLLPLNAAKLRIDETTQRYYISDNSGHNVLVTDFSGRLLGRSPTRTVAFPNQLAVTAPGELTVVDTGHRRLATFDVASGSFGPLKSEMSTDAGGVARPGRNLPFDSLRLPGGETAVLIAREGMMDADRVVFDPGGTPARRIDLGDDSDPFDIELWRGRIWVSDATHYRFESVNFDGSDRKGIEDAAFADELRDAARAPKLWKAIRLAAQVGVGLVPLLGILVMWRLGIALGKAPPAAATSAATSAAQPAASDEAIAWIDVEPDFAQRLRRRTAIMGWSFFAALILFCGYMLFSFRPLVFSAGGIVALGPLFVVFPILAVTFLAIMRRTDKPYVGLRLGASRDSLRIAGPGPRDDVVEWSRVYFDGGRLLAGKRLIGYQVPIAGDVFPRAALFDAVLARVPRDNFLIPAELGWKRLRAYLL